MLQTRVMPCLLVENRRLVKTVKFRNAAYVGDPVNAIKIYNEKEVDELILLDISATIEKKCPDFDLLKDVANECFMPLTYGGGIRTIKDIHAIFNLGIEKIAINTYAVENPEFISEAARLFGSQSIVIAIDVKKSILGKYFIATHSGKKVRKIDPVSWSKKMQNMGAGEILVNSIDRDGTWEGYDIKLIKQITDAVNLPVIACGGAGKVEDLIKAVREGGASAVAIGSMVVYQGKGLGVLINFPSREELKDIIEED